VALQFHPEEKEILLADGSGRRWVLIALAALTVLVFGVVVGFRVAVGILKDRVVEALGPGSEVKSIRVGWSGVEIRELRIKGGGQWPAAYALRAERVTLVPSLCSFLSAQNRIRSITIVRPYLSFYRTREGKLLVIPGLLSHKGRGETPSAPGASPTVLIGSIMLEDGVLELFDASVARPLLKIRLEGIRASLHDMAVPTLKGRSSFELTGVVKGPRRDGNADIRGWAEITTKDSSVKVKLRSVDMVALQPYLSKKNETKVQGGTLDLDLQSDIRNKMLKAPGKITISDLELAPAKGMFGSFMGVPRDAVVAFLKDKGGRITLDFVLEGDIGSPRFSLNETLSQRLAFSMADALKVSITGVARGAASLGEKGVETAGEVAKGVGGAIQTLFGGRKKK